MTGVTQPQTDSRLRGNGLTLIRIAWVIVALAALGVMAYQMLAGRVPFVSENPGALLMAHLSQPAPDPRDFRHDLPERAASAILRALAKDPDERPRTAEELVEALG
jgi:serine/threonine-protein kinase